MGFMFCWAIVSCRCHLHGFYLHTPFLLFFFQDAQLIIPQSVSVVLLQYWISIVNSYPLEIYTSIKMLRLQCHMLYAPFGVRHFLLKLYSLSLSWFLFHWLFFSPASPFPILFYFVLNRSGISGQWHCSLLPDGHLSHWDMQHF